MKTRQSGVTLVELMISLLLGSILSAAIYEIYMIQNKSAEWVRSVSSLQSDMQFVFSNLSQSIKLSGYWGGVLASDIEQQEKFLGKWGSRCDREFLLDLSIPVQGFEGGRHHEVSQQLPQGCMPNDYVEGSDILLVRYLDARNEVSDLALDNKSNKNRYLIRTVTGSAGLLFQGRYAQYVKEAIPSNQLVYNRPLQVVMYSLAPCSSKNCREGGVLNQSILAGSRFIKRSLVSGIDQIQFEYGIDLDGDGLSDRFAVSGNIKDWAQVRGIRVHLLMRQQSIDRSFVDSERHIGLLPEGSYLYKPEGKDKHFQRRLYSFVISRRNR